MSTRTRARAIAVASVLLTAAITGGTALLPTSAHAAEPQRAAAAAGRHVQAQASPPAQGGDNRDDAGTLAAGALAFTATGVALAFGIRHRSRQH